MKIKYLMPVIVFALILGSISVMAFENRVMTIKNGLRRFINKRIISVVDKVQPIDVEELKQKIPDQEIVEKEVEAVPIPRRFILWTYDGKHVMWGKYGNGYFTGKDNSGKYTWGIYGKHVFAGFYDGEFFWGRYRRGFWKAEGLFGLKTHGRYVTFPSVYPIPVAESVDG